MNRPDVMDEQTRGLLSVVAILRVALIAWSAAVLAVDINGTTEVSAMPAVVILVFLAIWSAAFGWLVRVGSPLVLNLPLLYTDAAVAALVAAADPILYTGPHPQSFASAWPLTGAGVLGIVLGTRPGALGGFLIGSTGAASVALAAPGGLEGRLLGSFGTVVLLTVGGALAGVVTERLRDAELTQARSQIREEVARKLHDGVLQTLAVVQRRSDDPDLVEMARDQEIELRSFITDPISPEPEAMSWAGLAATLRPVMRQAEKRHGYRCDLVVVDDSPGASPEILQALSGAVTEALTNASKHGRAERVTVLIDAAHGSLSCEIHDNGVGFDPASTPEGIGLSRSIRGRMEDVAGSVEVHSTAGRGTTVRLMTPITPPS